MEKLVTIIDQLPLASRPYTAQDGTQKVFNSRGFILGRDRRILRRNDGRHGGGGWRIRPHGVAQDAGLHQAALVSRQEQRDTI